MVVVRAARSAGILPKGVGSSTFGKDEDYQQSHNSSSQPDLCYPQHWDPRATPAYHFRIVIHTGTVWRVALDVRPSSIRLTAHDHLSATRPLRTSDQLSAAQRFLSPDRSSRTYPIARMNACTSVRAASALCVTSLQARIYYQFIPCNQTIRSVK